MCTEPRRYMHSNEEGSFEVRRCKVSCISVHFLPPEFERSRQSYLVQSNKIHETDIVDIDT